MAHSSSTAGSTRTWLPVDQLLVVSDLHQNHPQLLHIDVTNPRNHRRYHYLSWQVTHPLTPVVWSNNEWYKFHHSITTGQPYHKGQRIEIYPTPVYPDTEEESVTSIDIQIRSTPATIKPSGPGSPHCSRSVQPGTSSRPFPVDNPCNSNTMSTQTMATTMENITRTIVPGGSDYPPPSASNQHQNPQHIRDTFNIALG